MPTDHSRWSAVAAMLLIVFCLAPANAEPFHSEAGYSLDLPEGWVRIPDGVIQQTFAAVNKQGPITDAGFQLPAERWMKYPYVIVQIIPYAKHGLNRQITEAEMPKVVAAMTGLDADDIRDSLTDEGNKLMGETQFAKPKLDITRHRFTFGMSMDVQGIGNITGTTTGYFGREALMQVSYYTMTSEWADHQQTAKTVSDSFKFDAATAYQSSTPAADTAESAASDSSVPATGSPTPSATTGQSYACCLLFVAIAGVVLIVLVVVVVLVVKKTKSGGDGAEPPTPSA